MGAPSVSADRITKIRIQGFRSLEDVTLDLNGLSVLIGDNGSGKSAIIEAIETLRYFSEPAANLIDYFEQHPWPMRGGRGKFAISVSIDGNGTAQAPPLDYGFAIVLNEHGRIGVAREQLLVGPIPGHTEPLRAIQRDFDQATVFDQIQGKVVSVQASPMHLLLTGVINSPRPAGAPVPERRAIDRLSRVLSDIEVHVPFEVMPAWAARRTGRKTASREPSMLLPATRLELLGANLGNAFHSLRSEFGPEHWDETMAYVRLGLGSDVRDVSGIASAAGGQHAISVRYQASSSPVPASALSDGTLAYLAFVALLRLPSQRSLLAFDEPELHLHPGLLVRVLGLFESIARTCPVVIATHSDRLLDALHTPATSAVICELDEQRRTRLRRPSSELLKEWMRDFRGLGDLRAAGLQKAVMEVREKEE